MGTNAKVDAYPSCLGASIIAWNISAFSARRGFNTVGELHRNQDGFSDR